MQAATLKGVGMTPEGIENNPVMYELVMELPWRPDRFTKEEWLKEYVKARYGVDDPGGTGCLDQSGELYL